MIDCNWQAWYDRSPRAADPPLHVAADVVSDDLLGELRLIEDTACVCPAEVVCLTLEAERDNSARAATRQLVSWSGHPDRPVSEVRVDGIAAASIAVA